MNPREVVHKNNPLSNYGYVIWRQTTENTASQLESINEKLLARTYGMQAAGDLRSHHNRINWRPSRDQTNPHRQPLPLSKQRIIGVGSPP